jgi:hypothetical protein
MSSSRNTSLSGRRLLGHRDDRTHMLTPSSPLCHPPEAAPLMLVVDASVRGAWQAAQSPPLPVAVGHPGDNEIEAQLGAHVPADRTQCHALPGRAAPSTPKQSGLKLGSRPSRQGLELRFAEPVHCVTPTVSNTSACQSRQSLLIVFALSLSLSLPLALAELQSCSSARRNASGHRPAQYC